VPEVEAEALQMWHFRCGRVPLTVLVAFSNEISRIMKLAAPLEGLGDG